MKEQTLYIVTGLVTGVAANLVDENDKSVEVNVDITGFGSVGMYPVFPDKETAQNYVENHQTDIMASIIEVKITPNEESTSA